MVSSHRQATTRLRTEMRLKLNGCGDLFSGAYFFGSLRGSQISTKRLYIVIAVILPESFMMIEGSIMRLLA